MKKLWLIGIAGTNGSGKDTTGAILAEKFGYCFISVTAPMRVELQRRGLPIDREHMRDLSAEWRHQYGLAVLVDRAVDHYRQEKGNYTGLAVASLRNPAEADRVHELGGIVIWLDADPKLRYQRIQANAGIRNRAEEDMKTFEQFLAEEQMEMHGTGDAASLDMAAVKAKADYTVMNEFPNPEELAAELARVLKLDSVGHR